MGLKYLEFNETEIDKLMVNCKLFEIYVVGSASENIEISWRDTAMRSLEVKHDHRTLNIVDHAAVGIYGTLALINLKADNQLLIKIPGDYTGKAIYQSKADKIYLTNLKYPGMLGLSSNTGEILLENVECCCIDIKGNLGKINCYGVNVTENMDISSKTGSIHCYINGPEEEYSVFCQTKRHANSPAEFAGKGTRKLQIVSESGRIDYAFQNGIQSRKPAARYQRHNSFRDW